MYYDPIVHACTMASQYMHVLLPHSTCMYYGHTVRENNKSSICVRRRVPNFMCALVARGGHFSALLHNTCTSRLAPDMYTYAYDHVYLHERTSAQTFYTDAS